MATIVLSAVGAAAGASIGGGVLGLSSTVIGRAIGAGIGRAVDQRLMGHGSAVVENGRVDRFRLSSAGEGDALARVYGRVRLGGQVIWASRFLQSTSVSGGSGKGSSNPSPKVKSYSYSVSLAIGLCAGEISRVGRIWADGKEIAEDDLNLRIYPGSEDQLPDPKIEAVEGAGMAPAYRGLAYVVIENLELGAYGNRVPQFSFEVVRPAPADVAAASGDLAHAIRAVALIPGTGEYALATTPVWFKDSLGKARSANVSTRGGRTDFSVSIDDLNGTAPNCNSVSLVAAWFGDDLRCDRISLRPKVEQKTVDGTGMPWRVSGLARAAAVQVPQDQGRPVYGGTPTDAAIKEAIDRLHVLGKEVVFYPFILMDQLDGNGLVDPWSGLVGQPKLSWRGRITTSLAPGVEGTPDATVAAEAEVSAFFGAAQPGDFSASGSSVNYSGPQEWSYRRMILHYAHLCAAAGGVEAFCVGSELRGLTRIRGAGGTFPAVAALIELASDVRAILGAGTKIGYAADWTEYFGYHPQDGSGDVLFNLDPLWAHTDIDFVGIDNYMPMSDWREGTAHMDANWGSIYNRDYLKANIAGGEGFDWYYAGSAARDAQVRTPITDGAEGEPWIFRYKDIRNWWGNAHFERISGIRQANATSWIPESKPIWFTEIGCAAVDKGSNEPNRFVDSKSSESGLPAYSTGRRDELVQYQCLAAFHEYWNEPANNPVSEVYEAPMVDMARVHVWAWDARPFPAFPNDVSRWSDGDNYYRGHWMNGRMSARSLAGVVAEICADAGLNADVGRLYGLVRGYLVSDVGTGREALQPLLLAHGADALEEAGKLCFRSRQGHEKAVLGPDDVADTDENKSVFERVRSPLAEQVSRVRISYVDADADYTVDVAEAAHPDAAAGNDSDSGLALTLTRSEAKGVAERWLAEARLAGDTVRFSLPRARMDIRAGDVVALDEGGDTVRYRVDRVTMGTGQVVDAVRVEPNVYEPVDHEDEPGRVEAFVAPVPVSAFLMDLPLLAGTEVPHEPHVAAIATPWPGDVAVYSAPDDSGYSLAALVTLPATIGLTESTLDPAAPGQWDRGAALKIRLADGALASASAVDVLNGKNIAAIGDGSTENWEVFQFADAVLLPDGTFELTNLLRGQAGTDHLAETGWPVGCVFVLLDQALTQVDLPSAARGLARDYRIGPAGRSYSDPVYDHRSEAISGIGLRPLSPVHLRAGYAANGDVGLGWIRRARIDGDSWLGIDVPLGEESESYLIRVYAGNTLVREATVQTPGWAYTAVMQNSDGVNGALSVEVAQLSTQFGPGIFRKVTINV